MDNLENINIQYPFIGKFIVNIYFFINLIMIDNSPRFIRIAYPNDSND